MDHDPHTVKTITRWDMVRAWVHDRPGRHIEFGPFNATLTAILVRDGTRYEYAIVDDDPWIVAQRIIARFTDDEPTPAPP